KPAETTCWSSARDIHMDSDPDNRDPQAAQAAAEARRAAQVARFLQASLLEAPPTQVFLLLRLHIRHRQSSDWPAAREARCSRHNFRSSSMQKDARGQRRRDLRRESQTKRSPDRWPAREARATPADAPSCLEIPRAS